MRIYTDVEVLSQKLVQRLLGDKISDSLRRSMGVVDESGLRVVPWG